MEMKRLVIRYVHSVQEMLNSAGAEDRTGSAVGSASTPPSIEIGTGGYPKLPSSFNPGSFQKRDLDDVLKRYLGQHYCMFFL